MYIKILKKIYCIRSKADENCIPFSHLSGHKFFSSLVSQSTLGQSCVFINSFSKISLAFKVFCCLVSLRLWMRSNEKSKFIYYNVLLTMSIILAELYDKYMKDHKPAYDGNFSVACLGP